MMRRMLAQILCLCFGIWLIGLSVDAGAQSSLYGQILGGGSEEEEAPTQSRPMQLPGSEQGRPFLSFGGSSPASNLTGADYGLIAESVGDPMLNATQKGINLFRTRLHSTIKRLPQAWADIRTTLAASSPTGRPSYFLGVAIFALLLLAIGRAITHLYNAYIGRRIMVSLHRSGASGYLGKLPWLAYRVLFTTVGIGLTLVLATLVGLIFYQEHESTLTTVIIVFVAYGAVQTIDTIWRMAVAPYLPEYRIPAIEDTAARGLYRWLSFASAFGILSMSFVSWMSALGLAREVHTALTVILSLATVGIVLAMLRVHRRTISGMILSGRPRDEASWLSVVGATVWGPLLTLYLLFTWADMSFRLIMGFEAGPARLAVPYLIFLAGLILYAVISYAIERIFARNREIAAINAELDALRAAEDEVEQARLQSEIMARAGDAADVDDDGDEESGGPAVDERVRAIDLYGDRRPALRTMEDLARRAASIFAMGAVAYALLRFWGGAEVFASNPVLSILEDVIDVLFIGYIVYHAVRIWIDERIAEEVGDELPTTPGEGEGGGAGATRLATLLPLVRNFLLVVIGAAILLLLLMELGVNVAPLFAGAGIVGLAIGFGSQALVRDILSGAFFLMDDAFRKGEYIDVGNVKGTVEKISLRSFQLRHHLGMLHTIPFGEIQFLTNFSRDWVMMKLPLRLTYDTDIERVRKLIKKLGLRLLEDPEIGPKFMQPVKSQGVIQMDDSAMIVRIKFMTHPGEQWVLRKRIYAEIRELFEAEGIKFAHREVTVRLPDLDEKTELTEPQVKAIGAAARRVGDDIAEEELLATGTGGGGDTR